MGEKALVEGLITDAISLILQLDSNGDAPTLAVWYLYEDADEWRLLVGGPPFDKLLPKQEALAYQKIAEAISQAQLDSLTISMVKIVGTHGALPKALKSLVRTGPKSTVHAHFSSTTLNRIFVREMIIMRSA